VREQTRNETVLSNYAQVEAVIQQGLENTTPAIALAIYYKSELVCEHAYGYLDPDTKLRPTLPTTLFDLASVTKLYTTTVFLMQVAEGKVAVDDSVVSVIPEFGKYGLRPIEGGQNPHTLEREPADADTSQKVDPATITFRQLLTHTSGLAPWRDIFLQVGPVPPLPGESDPLSRSDRMTKALDLIAGFPYIDMPNRSVRYSDLGLIVLGEAVARLDQSATPAEAIQKRILRPFNFTHTTYNPPIPEICAPTEFDLRWRNRRCQGEVHDENACALRGIAGHAGLFGIAREVAAFGQNWLDAVKGQGQTWLPTDVAQAAVQEQTNGGYRGLGWVLKSPQGSSAGQHFSAHSFGHTGFTGTSLWIDPHRELAAAVLTNRVYNGRDSDEILRFRPRIHDALCQWVDLL
jgi:CubicO group peptidase (beta-lactamase class C family)